MAKEFYEIEYETTDSGMTPEMYQYYKGLEERRVILNKDVDKDILERVILPLMDMDNDGSGKPIEIILGTPGGSVFDGMALCDVIDRLKTPTTIRVMTYAFSMGGMILMAGYNNPNVKKVCYKHSVALLHDGQTFLEGMSS